MTAIRVNTANTVIAMGKYDGWDPFFADLEGHEQRFTLDDLVKLSGVDLPMSAYTHQAWRSNTSCRMIDAADLKALLP